MALLKLTCVTCNNTFGSVEPSKHCSFECIATDPNRLPLTPVQVEQLDALLAKYRWDPTDK